MKITEEDIKIVNKVKEFLSNLEGYSYDCSSSEVKCDKEDNYRIKDFSISFDNNYWFRTEYYNLSAHLTNDTKKRLNCILQLLKCHSEELGITGIQRRVFGIIFNARKK